MATTTPNLKLTKPAATDFYDVAVGNENLDKIDEAVTTLESDVGAIIDALAKKACIEVTATAAGWTGDGPYTQEIAVTGMTASCNAIVGLADTATAEEREACRDAMITPTAQAAGTVTLTADGYKPRIDLPLTVVILEGSIG